jgi:nucleoside-diphosphate-sugar epimerase
MTAITDDRRRSVLVTGAGGFLGSAVVEHLSRAGFRVRAWLGGPLDSVRKPTVPVETLQADIADEAAARQALKRIDVVVHLAGLPSVAASWEHPAEFARTHVVGTANLLQACVANGVRRMVAISSAEVYGQPDRNPVSEDSALKPRSPYGAVKLAAEHLVESFVVGRGLDAIVLRPFSIYGRGLSSASLLGTIFRQSLSGDRVVLNNLRPVRDYCHVDDLARAVVHAAETTLTGFHVFNIGTGIGTSVSDLAMLAMRLANHVRPLEENRSASRPGASEIDELIASIGNAREFLGWRPEVALEDGLKQTLDWWRTL